MAKEPVRDTTTTFIMIGKDIQDSIQHRIARHNGEISNCLTTVSDVLKEKAQHNTEQIAETAAALMLVFASGENLTASALSAYTTIERASFLSKEVLDLACIAKNLDSSGYYKVTLDEAKRYGMV